MQIEAGNKYRLRNGRLVTVERNPLASAQWPYIAIGVGAFHEDGTYRPSRSPSLLDIVALANDGPVRTVQRKEIVPGEYGPVIIRQVNGLTVDVYLRGNAMFSAETLRSAAAVFLELADALEGK